MKKEQSDKKTGSAEMAYKGYVGSIEVNLADNCLYGRVQGLSKMQISYEGQTLDSLKIAFEVSIDKYLRDCSEKKIEPQKPFKGSFNVRLSPELHRKAATIAMLSGVSLNNFIKKAVENQIQALSNL